LSGGNDLEFLSGRSSAGLILGRERVHREKTFKKRTGGNRRAEKETNIGCQEYV